MSFELLIGVGIIGIVSIVWIVRALAVSKNPVDKTTSYETQINFWKERLLMSYLADAWQLRYDLKPLNPQERPESLLGHYESFEGIYKGVRFKMFNDFTVKPELNSPEQFPGQSFYIELEVKNPLEKEFLILLNVEQNLTKEDIAKVTPEFDKELILIGDKVFSDEFYEMCTDYRWMNLMLKGNKLIYTEDYWIMQSHSKRWTNKDELSETHPICKNTQTTLELDTSIPGYTTFFDKLIEEAKLANLL